MNLFCLVFVIMYFIVFFMFEEKDIFIHWTLNLHVRELIKLILNFVKYCNDCFLFAFLFQFFGIKSFRFLIFAFVLSKPVQVESQTV